MEVLKLSDKEQKLYAELFQTCDVDNTGRISGAKASELLISSGLSSEILIQITEMCGAKRLGHFGRSQFYIALRLVAAVQSGLAVSFESFNSENDLSLPKFSKQNSDQGDVKRTLLSQAALHKSTNEQDSQSGPGPFILAARVLPPPPSKHHIRSLSEQKTLCTLGVSTEAANAQLNASLERQDSSSHTQNTTPPLSPPRARPPKLENLSQLSQPSTAPLSPTTGLSAGATTAMSPSNQHIPGPVLVTQKNILNGTSNTNSFISPSAEKEVEKEWASFEDDEGHGLVADSIKEWTGEHHKATDTSSVSSEAESEADVWSITDEQRAYYINQFKTMQPELDGTLLGATAKEFFEKSKLPVSELAKIWQLSDVNKDGALSLEEFCIAMHLVVLRRNNIELPSSLPATLMPYFPLTDEPFSSDLPPGSTMKAITPLQGSQQQWENTTTYPVESPTSAGVLTSPGSGKPVNFEFQPITAELDSSIAHPVALRMSPDVQGNSITPKSRTFSDPSYQSVNESVVDVDDSPVKPRSQTESQVDTCDIPNKFAAPLHSRPRPTPKKKKVPTATLR